MVWTTRAFGLLLLTCCLLNIHVYSNDELAATVTNHAPQLLNDLMELPK
jgi:hypothetical protein